MNLDTAKLGDIMVAGSLMKPVTTESVWLQVTKVSPDGILFDATFYGVFLGKVLGQVTDEGDKLTWIK